MPARLREGLARSGRVPTRTARCRHLFDMPLLPGFVPRTHRAPPSRRRRLLPVRPPPARSCHRVLRLHRSLRNGHSCFALHGRGLGGAAAPERRHPQRYKDRPRVPKNLMKEEGQAELNEKRTPATIASRQRRLHHEPTPTLARRQEGYNGSQPNLGEILCSIAHHKPASGKPERALAFEVRQPHRPDAPFAELPCRPAKSESGPWSSLRRSVLLRGTDPTRTQKTTSTPVTEPSDPSQPQIFSASWYQPRFW
jgi:hypothetical protein